MLVGLGDLLIGAAAERTAVFAFNVITLEHAEAIVAGANPAGVVLQISQNAVRYHRALEPIMAAALAVAQGSTAPVVVHLDHACEVDLVRAAVELGCSSVMFDGSALAYEANVATTAEVVRHCHGRGVAVEAELGEVGGKDGVHAPTARTRPDEAARFVADTGVDALAVAVGSSHAMTERTARLDLGLIAELRQAVPVPLVLHGSSGASDAELVRAVEAGITKINIGTRLSQVFTGALRDRLAAEPDLVDPRKFLAPARDAVAGEVARYVRLFGQGRE